MFVFNLKVSIITIEFFIQELPDASTKSEDQDDVRYSPQPQETASNNKISISVTSQADPSTKIKQEPVSVTPKISETIPKSATINGVGAAKDDSKSSINDESKTSNIASDSLKILNSSDSALKGLNDNEANSKGNTVAAPEDDVMDSLDFEEISDEELEEETKAKGKNLSVCVNNNLIINPIIQCRS